MNRVILAAIFLMTFAACSKTSNVNPQDDGQAATTENSAQAAVTQAPPQLTPEEMMAKMKEAATPGAAHAALKPLIGTWQTTSKMWSAPDAKPQVDKGTATHRWIYGKRFIQEDYKGKFNGQPFQGMGLLGYDNVKQAYIGTWTDTMSTGIMTSEGKFDPANKNLEMTSSFSCPLTGGEKQSRMVTKILSNNEHVLEMYDTAPDGKEFKMMEITYKRKG